MNHVSSDQFIKKLCMENYGHVLSGGVSGLSYVVDLFSSGRSPLQKSDYLSCQLCHGQRCSIPGEITNAIR